jgi:hypothetical protein
MSKPHRQKRAPKVRPMTSLFPPDMELTPQESRINTKLLRLVADSAAFPAMCRQLNGGCARTRRCRGDARECVGRFLDLVPDAARDWIDAVLEGKREGRTFDDVAAENPDELEAMEEWRAALAKAYR